MGFDRPVDSVSNRKFVMAKKCADCKQNYYTEYDIKECVYL